MDSQSSTIGNCLITSVSYNRDKNLSGRHYARLSVRTVNPKLEPQLFEMNQQNHACCGPGYASPEAAMQAESEKVLYAIALYTGTGIEEPDYLATVDVDPSSPTPFSNLMHRLRLPST